MRFPDPRDPLLAFALIAALLFAANAAFDRGNPKTLRIDEAEIEARVFLEELNSGAEVPVARRAEIAQATIEEMVLVAEARARGLDNDSRITTLLAQKMLHVMSADLIQPTPDELEAFFAANAERYEQPTTFDLDEAVLGKSDERTLETVLAVEPERLRALPSLSERDLASIFSTDFAAQIVTSGGDWVGPFPSNRGRHWLRVRQIQPSGIPPLDSVVEQVRLDWITQEEERRQREQVAELLSSYTLIRSAGDEAQ